MNQLQPAAVHCSYVHQHHHRIDNSKNSPRQSVQHSAYPPEAEALILFAKRIYHSNKGENAAIMTPPLHLTIRFSTSIPDLELDIPSPQSTTVLSLKHLLRRRIETRNRLRLIYQGRLLPDSSALSSVVKAPPPPPPSSSQLGVKGVLEALAEGF